MNADPSVSCSPLPSTLPVLATPADVPAVWERPGWLPVVETCGVVSRITGEMALLVAERILHRRDRRRMMWHIRQIAMYVCHVALQIPMGDIADAFGRSRSTVAYSIRIVEDRRDDKAYDGFVGAVERMAIAIFPAAEESDDD